MRMIKKNRIKKYLLLSGVFDEFLNLLFSKLKKKQTQKIFFFLINIANYSHLLTFTNRKDSFKWSNHFSSDQNFFVLNEFLSDF